MATKAKKKTPAAPVKPTAAVTPAPQMNKTAWIVSAIGGILGILAAYNHGGATEALAAAAAWFTVAGPTWGYTAST